MTGFIRGRILLLKACQPGILLSKFEEKRRVVGRVGCDAIECLIGACEQSITGFIALIQRMDRVIQFAVKSSGKTYQFMQRGLRPKPLALGLSYLPDDAC